MERENVKTSWCHIAVAVLVAVGKHDAVLVHMAGVVYVAVVKRVAVVVLAAVVVRVAVSVFLGHEGDSTTQKFLFLCVCLSVVLFQKEKRNRLHKDKLEHENGNKIKHSY